MHDISNKSCQTPTCGAERQDADIYRHKTPQSSAGEILEAHSGVLWPTPLKQKENQIGFTTGPKRIKKYNSPLVKGRSLVTSVSQ